MITRVLQRCWRGAMNATKPNLLDYRHELMLFDFTKEETVAQWDCVSDTDVEGLSTATFKPNGKGMCLIVLVTVRETGVKVGWLILGSGAVFSGELNTRLRPESKAIYGGYCALRSKPKDVRARSGTYVGSTSSLKGDCLYELPCSLAGSGKQPRMCRSTMLWS